MTRQVSCRGERIPFVLEAVSAPPLAEDGHPAIPSVRQFLRERGSKTVFHTDGDIRLLAEQGDLALFSVGDTSTEFATLKFARGDGEWVFSNSFAECHLLGWARGRPANPWSIDGELDRSSRRINILVTEMECASGASADGRIDEPDIEWGGSVVIVTITIRTKPGLQNCPSNPSMRLSIELPEPLGSRELLDGFYAPPAAPR